MDADRARQQLENAQAMSLQLEQELQALWLTLDPYRRSVTPEELRLLQEQTYWIDATYAAEHAIARTEELKPGVTGTHGRYQWFTSVDHGSR